jgi:hypothetical protein
MQQNLKRVCLGVPQSGNGCVDNLRCGRRIRVLKFHYHSIIAIAISIVISLGHVVVVVIHAVPMHLVCASGFDSIMSLKRLHIYLLLLLLFVAIVSIVVSIRHLVVILPVHLPHTHRRTSVTQRHGSIVHSLPLQRWFCVNTCLLLIHEMIEKHSL